MLRFSIYAFVLTTKAPIALSQSKYFQYPKNTQVRCLRILEVTFYSNMTFGTHLTTKQVDLWEVVPKVARSLGVVLRAGNLFDCPSVLKSCFNAYVLPTGVLCFEWLSCAESHLSLLKTVVRGAKELCEGKLCSWGTEERSVPCVYFMKFITERTPFAWVSASFFAALKTRASAALCELVLATPPRRTD